MQEQLFEMVSYQINHDPIISDGNITLWYN